MSFSTGFLQAIGFQAGMAMHSQSETRPILRKRMVSTFVYILTTIYCLYKSFSVHPVESRGYLFQDYFRRVGLTDFDNWYLFIIFSVLSILLLITFGVINLIKGRRIREYSVVGIATIFISFCGVMYFFTYDIVYHFLGNMCVPQVNAWCINFASNAQLFASASLLVYLFRSTFVLTPRESGYISFFGTEVKELKSGGVFVMPTLPAPHPLVVLLITAFEMVPLFWDFYHNPDGRERAVQIIHRK